MTDPSPDKPTPWPTSDSDQGIDNNHEKGTAPMPEEIWEGVEKDWAYSRARALGLALAVAAVVAGLAALTLLLTGAVVAP